ELVLNEGSAESEPELIPVALGLRAFNAAARLGRRSGQSGARVVAVRASVDVVRARLRHDVDESARGAAELGVGAVGDDDDLLNGVEVEGEWRPRAPALLA